MNRLFSTEEKDKIRVKAEKAYIDMYGEPTSDMERFYVMKGIESMAAVLYTAVEDKRREQEEHLQRAHEQLSKFGLKGPKQVGRAMLTIEKVLDPNS